MAFKRVQTFVTSGSSDVRVPLITAINFQGWSALSAPL